MSNIDDLNDVRELTTHELDGTVGGSAIETQAALSAASGNTQTVVNYMNWLNGYIQGLGKPPVKS